MKIIHIFVFDKILSLFWYLWASAWTRKTYADVHFSWTQKWKKNIFFRNYELLLNRCINMKACYISAVDNKPLSLLFILLIKFWNFDLKIDYGCWIDAKTLFIECEKKKNHPKPKLGIEVHELQSKLCVMEKKTTRIGDGG